MEIKFKLFTTIAQALDRLKKQFDKTDKSLVKTQTTLDETIVNIDNVVDSVARTMTEALDPYFVDMIYGYIDDNGKFKLGIIKDAWKDGVENVIPSNMVYIYHWGDNEIFKTITSYVTLFNGCKQSKMDVDFTMLFPNVSVASMKMLAVGSTFNKVILNSSMLLYKGYHGNGLVDSCIINHLIIIDEPDIYKSSDKLVAGGHIEHLELRNVKNLLRNASDLGSLISNCSFGFEKTTDIIGWNNIEYYESLNIAPLGTSGTSGKNKLNTFIMNHMMSISIWNDEYWIENAYLDADLGYVDDTSKFRFLVSNCKKLYIYLPTYCAFHSDNRTLSVHNDCKVYIADYSEGSPDYRETSKDYVLHLSGYTQFYTNTFTPIFKIGRVVFGSVSHISTNALDFGFIKSIKFSSLSDFNSFLAAASKSAIWNLTTRDEIENNSIEIFIGESTLSHIDMVGTAITASLFSKFKIESVNCNQATSINADAFRGSGLKHIDLGAVTKISARAFEDTLLESIDLSNIVSIENNAFENTNIKELILPDSYGESDLPDCIARYCDLNLMVIPAIITDSDSDEYAFRSCKKLYIKGDRVFNVEDRFGKADVIYVPDSVLDSYKIHSYWKKQADKIFPYDFELNPDNI